MKAHFIQQTRLVSNKLNNTNNNDQSFFNNSSNTIDFIVSILLHIIDIFHLHKFLIKRVFVKMSRQVKNSLPNQSKPNLPPTHSYVTTKVQAFSFLASPDPKLPQASTITVSFIPIHFILRRFLHSSEAQPTHH